MLSPAVEQEVCRGQRDEHSCMGFITVEENLRDGESEKERD